MSMVDFENGMDLSNAEATNQLIIAKTIAYLKDQANDPENVTPRHEDLLTDGDIKGSPIDKEDHMNGTATKLTVQTKYHRELQALVTFQ